MKYRCVEESPAGLAAFSLWIHGGRWCRPPISRQGSKSGYAHALGAIAGIRAGEGAGAYVWSEADADVRGLLRAYPDAAMLRRIAEIIRGWVDEEPRALWTRLRAERKARVERGESVGAPEVAGWVISSMWSYEQGNVRTGFVGPGERRQDTSATAAAAACKNLAEYAQIAASNRLINVAGPDRDSCAREIAAAAAARTMPQASARGATDGDFLPRVAPSGVVRYAPDAPAPAIDALAAYAVGHLVEHAGTTADFNDRLPSRWPPVYVSPSILPAPDLAELLGTPGDLEGVLCYGDPPYVGTTGYLADYPRAAVVCDAIDRARMGARVMVSESAPVAELVALGWHATRIDFARKGQRRTFARVATEWVTSNFEPVDAYRDVEQVGLFG